MLTRGRLNIKHLNHIFNHIFPRKPSVPNIDWKPIGEQFYFLNISGPNDIKLDVKNDFSAENFWKTLGLLENANLFPDNLKTEL